MFSSVRSIDLGVITEWSGTILNIPPGWSLCDGSNGTPDYTDRFQIGSGPTFSVGEDGGATTHDHDFTSNGHSHELTSFPFVISGTGGANVETSNDPLIGTTDPASSLPTYYALAYIQFTDN